MLSRKIKNTVGLNQHKSQTNTVGSHCYGHNKCFIYSRLFLVRHYNRSPMLTKKKLYCRAVRGISIFKHIGFKTDRIDWLIVCCQFRSAWITIALGCLRSANWDHQGFKLVWTFSPLFKLGSIFAFGNYLRENEVLRAFAERLFKFPSFEGNPKVCLNAWVVGAMNRNAFCFWHVNKSLISFGKLWLIKIVCYKQFFITALFNYMDGLTLAYQMRHEIGY